MNETKRLKKYVFETIRMETKDYDRPKDVGSDRVNNL